MIIGKAIDDCIIKPKKGLNIPYSIYDDNFKLKYMKTILKRSLKKS